MVRSFRKTDSLPWTKTYEVEIDPAVVPSGKIDVYREKLVFKPLALPENAIQQWTLNAAVSNDNKFLLSPIALAAIINHKFAARR